MNKQQFVEALNALLAALPVEERARLISYYTEMIDDRIEEGMPEAEAVAALGDPAGLVREFLPPEGAPAAAPEAEGAVTQALAIVPGQGRRAETPGSDIHTDALNEIRVQVRNADIQLERVLGDDSRVQITASNPERFRWALRDGLLEVTELPEVRRGFFGLFAGESPKLTLGLSNLPLQRLRVESHGGDIGGRDLEITGQALLASDSGDVFLQRAAISGGAEVRSRSGDVELIELESDGAVLLTTSSGDLRLSRARAAGLEISTASGDLELDELSAAEALTARTSSGDIELRRGARAREVRLQTAAGDISARGVTGHRLSFASASGDIELEAPEAYEALSVESRSGDVRAVRVDAPEATLSTVSGDLSVRLANRPEGWAVQTHTVTGDTSMDNLPPAAGPNAARASLRTTSGDLSVSVEG